MGWSEYIDQPVTQCDWKGGRVCARRFKVWGESREKVCFKPDQVFNASGESLPAIRSEWNGMKLDRYTAEKNGIMLDVLAYYSSVEQVASWSASFKTERVRLPSFTLAQLEQSTNGVAQNMSAVSADLGRTVPVSFTLKRLTVPVNVYELPATYRSRYGLIALIQEQANRIHSFPLGLGTETKQPYLFQGAEVNRIGYVPGSQQDGGCEWFDVTYSWMHDTGIVHPDALPDAAAGGGTTDPTRRIIIPGPFRSRVYDEMHDSLGWARWARPPFEDVIPLGMVRENSGSDQSAEPGLAFAWWQENACTTRCDYDLRYLDSYGDLPGYQ